MKYFADDYATDVTGKAMKIVKASLQRYELFHFHTNAGWRPLWDIYETEDDLIVLVELAGMQAEEVEFNVGRKRVQIRGSRCRPFKHDVTRLHQMEIVFGPFHHMITLPEPVQPNGGTSIYRDGFLLIRLPKEVKSSNLNS